MRIVSRNIRLAVAAFAISCFAPAQASAQLDPKPIQSSVDIFNTDNTPRPSGWGTPTAIANPRFVRFNFTVNF